MAGQSATGLTLILPVIPPLTMVMTIMLPFRLSMTLLTTPMMMFFLLVYLHFFAFLYNFMFLPPALGRPSSVLLACLALRDGTSQP